MNRFKVQCAWILGLAAVAVVLGGATIQADTVVGVFSNPVLAGTILNYPALNDSLYFDNTATAYSNISPDGSTLKWGVNPGSGLPDAETYSQLQFVGGTVPADPSTPFQIGTINFQNGTSALNSIIFGATLTFYLSSDLTNAIGSDNVIITTTNNVTGSLAPDADYVNICGPSSNMCDQSLQAYEDSEDLGAIGIGVTAGLEGFIDDLTVTGFNPPPGGYVNGI